MGLVWFLLSFALAGAAELRLLDGRTLICQGLSYTKEGAFYVIDDRDPVLVPWNQISPEGLKANELKLQKAYIAKHLDTAKELAESDPVRARGLVVSMQDLMEALPEDDKEESGWVDVQVAVADQKIPPRPARTSQSGAVVAAAVGDAKGKVAPAIWIPGLVSKVVGLDNASEMTSPGAWGERSRAFVAALKENPLGIPILGFAAAFLVIGGISVAVRGRHHIQSDTARADQISGQIWGGVVAGGALAILTYVAMRRALGAENSVSDLVYADILLIFLLTAGIFIKSRIASTVMVVYVLGLKALQLWLAPEQMASPVGLIGTLLLLVLTINAAVGAFRYHWFD